MESGFLSNIFLVHKKDEGQRPVINLKALNQFVNTEHFKMEGIHTMKDLERWACTYIDDILIIAEPKEKALNHAEGMVYLLGCLGFVYNQQREISARSESDHRIFGPNN